MSIARHIAMAVDLATQNYNGLEWMLAQVAASRAIYYYVLHNSEIIAEWSALPPDKQTADSRYPEPPDA